MDLVNKRTATVRDIPCPKPCRFWRLWWVFWACWSACDCDSAVWNICFSVTLFYRKQWKRCSCSFKISCPDISCLCCFSHTEITRFPASPLYAAAEIRSLWWSVVFRVQLPRADIYWTGLCFCLFTVLPQAAAPCVETAGQERRTETEVEMFQSIKIIHNLNGSFIFGGSYLFKRSPQARQTIIKDIFIY